MDLTLTADQETLREVFADLFAKESPSARVRAAEPLGFDAELWRTLVAAEVPLMGVSGASLADLVVVAREAGRRLAPVPLAEVWAATRLLARYPGTGSALTTGSSVPTLALRPLPAGSPLARLVPAGAVAERVLVLVGEDLCVVRRDAPPGGAPPNLGCQPLADVPLAGATVLATGARDAYRTAVTEWTLLTAALLDGLRAEALRISVEYVTSRQAFGVPIGWFQTVAHRLADAATAGDGAELLVHEAAWALDREHAAPGNGHALALMAFLHAADVAAETAGAGLQFHGGYGYTLEYDIQLYRRRATAWPLALGAPRDLYRALAREVF
ncbi:acyl-CoA dehydrogenase [Cryptosporangium arvum]|uniref:acyl-CoA dehydrogenase n=1 Tax=Cryptosporangium arvum TaxID=80871 RepID=UPI0004B2D617|nr:acyl-CoA dehydrogenase [Cryptosporangium arvum]